METAGLGKCSHSCPIPVATAFPRYTASAGAGFEFTRFVLGPPVC